MRGVMKGQQAHAKDQGQHHRIADNFEPRLGQVGRFRIAVGQEILDRGELFAMDKGLAFLFDRLAWFGLGIGFLIVGHFFCFDEWLG
jgi:hypothetical protein